MKRLTAGLLTVSLAFAGLAVHAQEIPINYDESKIAPYVLPDPLIFNDGQKVQDARQWTNQRRDEIREIFASEMFGHIPAAPKGYHFRSISEEKVFGGAGICKLVRIYFDGEEQHWTDLMIFLPKTDHPVPVFVGLNFNGNKSTLDGTDYGVWPYEKAIKAGFAIATACRNEIEPDGKECDPEKEGFTCRNGGVRSWYNLGGDWGTISAWAWGLGRIMDYLEADPDIDAGKMAVLGHSRLGKTALWCAANDSRPAIVISNCSGCCGAAISRRCIGENFARIATSFPHWFTPEFNKYKFNEASFPADQHWLAAMAAPRPLYIVSATEDQWADPKGEWECAKAVAPVYKLFGKKGVGSKMPAPDHPDNKGTVAYHIHTGEHDMTAFEWDNYMSFAARHFSMKK